jgi:hypothetical protein
MPTGNVAINNVLIRPLALSVVYLNLEERETERIRPKIGAQVSLFTL